MSQLPMKVFAGIAVAAFAAVVLAQNPAPEAAPAQPKAEPAAKSILQKMDRNNDGKVTAEEHELRLKEWLKELDKNGDGKLAPDEFKGSRFVEMDVNKDGTVTVEEYLVFFVGKDLLAKAEGTAASETLYPKDAKEITGVEVIAFRKGVFKAINAGGNGKMTPEEEKAYTSKQFEYLDKNKDGLVTDDEIIAFTVMPVFASKAAAPAENK